jgi:hypothetical protein
MISPVGPPITIYRASALLLSPLGRVWSSTLSIHSSRHGVQYKIPFNRKTWISRSMLTHTTCRKASLRPVSWRYSEDQGSSRCSQTLHRQAIDTFPDDVDAHCTKSKLLLPPSRYCYLASASLFTLGDWSPISAFASALENIHTSLGLSWTSTTVISTLAIRSLLLIQSLRASRQSLRLLPFMPELETLSAEMRSAARDGDQARVNALKGRRKNILETAEVHLFDMLVPPFIWAPAQTILFLGVYRLCTSPSFAAEGIAWFPSLGSPDPTGILPILTSASIELALSVRTSPRSSTKRRI